MRVKQSCQESHHWPTNFSYRTSSEYEESRKRTTSTKTQVEQWKNDRQTHEQVIMGQSTGRSEAKMKAFLDDIEAKMEGNHRKTERDMRPNTRGTGYARKTERGIQTKSFGRGNQAPTK